MEYQLSPSPFPLSQMVGTQPSRTPHPRWWAQARAAIWGRACFCPHMTHSFLQALPCSRPGLQHVGPKPWCCPESSPASPALSNVKFCQLSQAPQRGFKDFFWWGIQWQGIFCPPAGPGMAMKEVHSDLPHLPRTGLILAWLCPILLRETGKVQIP